MANALTDLNRQAKIGSIAAELKFQKRRPFENDPDLRRTINRLGNPGNQLAGWVSSPQIHNVRH